MKRPVIAAVIVPLLGLVVLGAVAVRGHSHLSPGRTPDKMLDKNSAKPVVGGKATRKALGGAMFVDLMFLDQLISDSDIVVYGTAGDVLREGRVPWDLPADSPGGQSATLQQFNLLQTIKGPDLGASIKVFQPGAVINGVLFGFQGVPRMVSGRNYVLFLQGPNAKSKAAGYTIAKIHGVNYNIGGLDQYTLTTGAGSMIMFDGSGLSCLPFDDYQTGDKPHYAAHYSPDLYGKTPDQVIADIKAVQTNYRTSGHLGHVYQ